MAGSSVAGIITACAAVLIAFGGVITAFAALLPMLRLARSTHSIVNSEKTNRLNFQRALIRALTDAGVPVPIDQSLQDPPPPA